MDLIDTVAKVHQAPQRRAGPPASRVRRTIWRQRQWGIFAGGEAGAFGVQRSLLLFDLATLGGQGGVLLRQALAGGLLRPLQCTASRVVAVQARDPPCQRIESRRATVDAQLPQAVEMNLPRLQHCAALPLDSGIGVLAPHRGCLGFIPALVAGLLLAHASLFGLIQVIAVALHQRHLLASRRDDASQVIAAGVEGEGLQSQQGWRIESGERVAGVHIGNSGVLGTTCGDHTRIGQRLPGERGALAAFAARLALALEPNPCVLAPASGSLGIVLTRLGVAGSLLQAVRILHRRVGLQLLQASPAARERDLGAGLRGLRQRLACAGCE